jgi:tetratricopeptide (TPR) repeat protein/NAD-dependent SIR2 family protein deacetylase
MANYWNTLGSKNLAVFCGAGISKNSGIPLADELKAYILSLMPIYAEKSDVDLIMSALPFEAFIEIVQSAFPITLLLDVFNGGEPNANHLLIAKLAKLGYIRTIVTTNFDLLIERALEKEGLSENKDFRVFRSEDEFILLDFQNLANELRDTVAIFKIHGSADRETSLRATMHEVASEVLSQARMDIIRYLFSSGNHDRVLVLGYSCSDFFDITPQIENLRGEPLKEVVLIQHASSQRSYFADNVEDIRNKKERNPFKGFPGKRIICNTDFIINGLRDSCPEPIGNLDSVESSFDWKKTLANWAAQFGVKKCVASCISGLLCLKISDFHKAREFLYAALSELENIGQVDGLTAFMCRQALVNTFFAQGLYKQTIQSAEEALSATAGMQDQNRLEASLHHTIGNAHTELGEFELASTSYEAALDKIATSDDLRDLSIRSFCYGGLGNILIFQDKPEEARNYHEAALSIALQVGNKSFELRCHVNLGNAWLSEHRAEKAIKEYQNALNTARLIGDIAGQAGCCVDLGIANAEAGHHKQALTWLDEALDIAKVSEDYTVLPKCYVGYGKVYSRLDKFKRAIKCYDIALDMNKKVGAPMTFFECYKELSLVFICLKCYEQAIRCGNKAKKHAKRIGRADLEASCSFFVNIARKNRKEESQMHPLFDIRMF